MMRDSRSAHGAYLELPMSPADAVRRYIPLLPLTQHNVPHMARPVDIAHVVPNTEHYFALPSASPRGRSLPEAQGQVPNTQMYPHSQMYPRAVEMVWDP